MLQRSDLKEMKPYKDFKLWFKMDVANKFIVVKNVYDTSYDIIEILNNTIQPKGYEDSIDWAAFTSRPEYTVYQTIDVTDKPNEELIDVYENLLLKTTMVITESDGGDPDKSIDSVFRCLDWLRTTDFYTAPSSTQYHDAEYGGLLKHTLKVTSKCMELCKSSVFYNKVDVAKAMRACLMHDWCKIGMYESYSKNVKNEYTGEWDSVLAYRHKKDRMISLGHGASSMFLANKFFRLSYGEALAIRWHMGEFNVSPSEMQELSQATRTYPIVYLVQFADRLACVEY